MIGMLEIVLAQQPASLAPVHVREPDVEKDQVDVPGLDRRECLRRGMGHMGASNSSCEASCSARDRARS